ncbi:helix-turn-helix DNA binding domain [Arthrobacter phage Racecar]|nr:helix-turn-helix DNA binding domain protein [Arthrobacter phage Racecar]
MELSEEKINEFLRRSRLGMDVKKEIVELVLNEPGIAMTEVARRLEVPLPSVRTGFGYLGIDRNVTARVKAEGRLKAGEAELIEKIRAGAGRGESARVIGEELDMAPHRVSYIMKREGIVKAKVQRHGRATDYNMGCRCDLCRAANTERMAKLAIDRQARPEDIPHGTESGYVNWYCRCDECRPVGLAKLRERTTVPEEGMVRVGEIWTGAEIARVYTYDDTAREHALALGRSVHGVNAARAVRGIRRSAQKARTPERVGL